jgi:glutamate/tyrosine decarboxylase-like PLP-dependent enzyme
MLQGKVRALFFHVDSATAGLSLSLASEGGQFIWHSASIDSLVSGTKSGSSILAL